jgi:hypothetical protein
VVSRTKNGPGVAGAAHFVVDVPPRDRRPVVNRPARDRHGAELSVSRRVATDHSRRFGLVRRIIAGVSGPWPTVGGLSPRVRPEGDKE